MSDLIAKIKAAQRDAGERAVMASLEGSGLTVQTNRTVADIPDAELLARYDMLKSWLAEADAVNDILKKHLGRVLEIAYTWQPSYATKMDRDTLTLAAKSIGHELPPNGPGEPT